MEQLYWNRKTNRYISETELVMRYLQKKFCRYRTFEDWMNKLITKKTLFPV